MIVIVRQSEQTTESHRAFWCWGFQNGFIATEIADDVVVDTEAGTLSVRRWLPIAQPGDPDFPELQRDAANEPLAESCVLPLRAALPAELVTARQEQLAA